MNTMQWVGKKAGVNQKIIFVLPRHHYNSAINFPQNKSETITNLLSKSQLCSGG